MKRSQFYKLGMVLIIGMLGAGLAASHASLILNSSFESPVADGSEPPPDNWNFFTSGPNSSGVVSSEFARTGGQVLQFFAPPSAGDANSYQGYFQSTNVTLATSNRVVYSVYIRSSPLFPLADNATGKIGIEFHQGGPEIYRVESVFGPSQISTGEWRLFTIDTYNTTDVDQLVFTIVQLNGATPNSGIFWAEDAFAEVVPEPSMLGLLLAGGFVARVAHKRLRRKEAIRNA